MLSTQWLTGDAGRSPKKRMKRGLPWPHIIPLLKLFVLEALKNALLTSGGQALD